MTIECRICPGRVCTDLALGGRLQNDNGDAKPVDLSKIKVIPEKIAECDFAETQRWSKLEGKVDTLHLGS